jgi:hypothetical protein
MSETWFSNFASKIELCDRPPHTNTSQIPQGFGVPWDVTNPSVMLVSGQCTPPHLGLEGREPGNDQNPLCYKTAYVAPSGANFWTPVDLFGASLISGTLYSKSAQGVTTISDTTKPTYYVAYTCIWTGSAWKCGCRDAACTQSYWQLQKKIQQ